MSEKLTCLVLSRKINERIKIGDDVWITLTECRGSKVRLMIDAPKSVKIVRDEILKPEEQYNHIVRGIPVSKEDCVPDSKEVLKVAVDVLAEKEPEVA